MVKPFRIFIIWSILAGSLPSYSAACIHGASPKNEIGYRSGKTRFERVTANYEGGSPTIVKFFVAPSNAKVQAVKLGSNQLVKLKDLSDIADRLGETSAREFAPAGRGLVSRLVLENGITLQVFKHDRATWPELKKAYGIPTPEIGGSVGMEAWTGRVNKYGKSIFAAYISIPENLKNGNTALLTELGVSIEYGEDGNKLLKSMIIDKYLEFLVTHKVPVIFGFGTTSDQALVSAFTAALREDPLIQESIKPKNPNQVLKSWPDAATQSLDIGVEDTRQEIKAVLFKIKQGAVYYKNSRFTAD